MKSAFRKLSRVGTMAGGIRWYLSEDCLLAAKRMMYTVEYRRFYLSDLESIVVWPTRLWLVRLTLPAVLMGGLSIALWQWANPTIGAISGGVALAWVALELLLGPTAGSRIRTSGATVDLPLVKRTRRARKVLAKIDAAIRAARGPLEQPATQLSGAEPGFEPAQPPAETNSVTPSATTSVANAAETNGS